MIKVIDQKVGRTSFTLKAQNAILRRGLELTILIVLIGGFVLVAAERLGAAPIPDTDESMTLQVPYEMLYRGKLAFPMYRYLGGNIENVWHSYTPLFFAMLSGFMKVFGWGLLQGRVFNLLMAVFVLLMVHLIGRRLFDWQTGLIAVVMLISDPTFVDRSRLVRNDYAGALFALLAFYLYEIAEQRKRAWLYVASGLAAGAGVMCHTNLIYILCVIFALMLLKHGWKLLKTRNLYLFGAGAFVVMAYELVYDIIDYKNFLAQNRQDEMHFSVLSPWGWWINLQEEISRYDKWYNGWLKFDAPLTLLHVFLYLTIVAVVYLIVRWVIQIKRGNALSEPRVRILLVTVIVVLFFGIVTQRKVILYVIHLAPWFALSVGVLLRDGMRLLGRLQFQGWPKAKLIHRAAMAILVCAVAIYAYQLVKQNRSYLRHVNDSQLATFDEFKEVLRSVVPDGLCPVAIKSGVLWLAFPEKDHCFAAIENRMMDAVNIKGNDYALLVRRARKKKERAAISRLLEGAHLLAELKDTPYKGISVYYTGLDPKYRSIAPVRYYFFGKERGHVSEEQIAAAREVWSAGTNELHHCAGSARATVVSEGLAIQQGAGDAPVILCSIELRPETIYQISMEATSRAGGWELAIADDDTGAMSYRGKIPRQDGPQLFQDLFKTRAAGRVRLNIRYVGQEPDSLIISRIIIREVAPIKVGSPKSEVRSPETM